MKKYIDGLITTTDNKKLLDEIFCNNKSQEFHEFSERTLILKSALQYLGLTYQRTEELDRNTIDCSTLTSQSYWEGSFIRIPFIADSQRSSHLAEIIQLKDLKPGDIVVKYQNIEESPDKLFNHVGLYLGMDSNNVSHVIESNSKEGCVINTLEKFGPKGGFRRYIKNDNLIVDPLIYATVFDLATKVPKLSRLWSRQYTKISNNERIIHKGIDIYINSGILVKSPIEGILTFGILDNEFGKCAIIINTEMKIKCILGNIKFSKEMRNNSIVQKGEIIGKIGKVSNKSLLNYAVFGNTLNHLHFEVVGSIQTPYNIDKCEIDGNIYYNGLYLAKLKIIDLPL